MPTAQGMQDISGLGKEEIVFLSQIKIVSCFELEYLVPGFVRDIAEVELSFLEGRGRYVFSDDFFGERETQIPCCHEVGFFVNP